MYYSQAAHTPSNSSTTSPLYKSVEAELNSSGSNDYSYIGFLDSAPPQFESYFVSPEDAFQTPSNSQPSAVSFGDIPSTYHPQQPIPQNSPPSFDTTYQPAPEQATQFNQPGGLVVPPFEERGFASEGLETNGQLYTDPPAFNYLLEQWVPENLGPLVADLVEVNLNNVQSRYDEPWFQESGPTQTPSDQATPTGGVECDFIPQPTFPQQPYQSQPQQQYDTGNATNAEQQEDMQVISKQPQHLRQDAKRANFYVNLTDTHLGFAVNNLELIGMYKEYLWIYFPLHPAVFDESNIRQFFAHNEELENITPLSISTSLAACLGAWLSGNKYLASEYEAKTLSQISYLSRFASSMGDYSLAMAAYVLGNYALFYMGNAAKSREYLQLAMDICKQLNALNSDVYNRCLYTMSSHANASYQNIKRLKDELQVAAKLPYFSIISTTSALPYSTTISSDMQSTGSNTCPLSPRALNSCCDLVRVATNIVGGIRLLKAQRFQYAGNPNLGAQVQHMLQNLVEAIGTYEVNASAIFSRMTEDHENLPQSATAYTALLLLVCKMECHRLAGAMDKATDTAMKVVATLEQYIADGSQMYLSGGVLKLIDPVFECFLERDHLTGLESLLSCLNRVSDIAPIIDSMRNSHKNKLEVALDRRRAQQELQQQQLLLQQQYQAYAQQSPENYSQTATQTYNQHYALQPSATAGNPAHQYYEPSPPSPASTASPMAITASSATSAPQISYQYSYNVNKYNVTVPLGEVYNSGEWSPMGALSSQQKRSMVVPAAHLAPQSVAGGSNGGPRPAARLIGPATTSSASRKRPFPPTTSAVPYQSSGAYYAGTTGDSSNGAGIGDSGMMMPRKKRRALASIASVQRIGASIESLDGPSNAPIPSLHNEGTHLSLVGDCTRYLSEFRRYIWHFFPLHPAVLDESNVKYFLSQEGSEEISSLSLGYYACLCRGAMIAGHKEMSTEFFNKAEQQLFHLMEAPNACKDYSIALAVGVLIWQASYLQVKTEKTHQYLNIALDICKAIKAFNSDVFIRCNYILSTLPHGIDQIEKMQQSLEKVSRYPYHPITATTPESFAFYQGGGNVTIVKGGTKSFRCPSQLQQRMPVSIRNLTNITAVCSIMANIMSGLNLAPQELNLAVIDRVLVCIDSLAKLVEEIKEQQKKSEDYWPHTTNKHNRFFILATRAQCLYLKGDREQALGCAKRFVEVMEKPKFKSQWVSVSACTGMVLKVLFDYGEDDLFVRQLKSTEKWIPTLPVMETVRREYEKLFQARKMNQQGGTGMTTDMRVKQEHLPSYT